MPPKTDITKQTKELLSGDMQGAYFLWGEEEYLKRAFLSDVKKLVCPDDELKTFNITVFDSLEDKDGILSAMSCPPQFSDKRLVVIYGAELKKSKESLDTLCAIMKKAADYKELTLIVYMYASQLDGAESDTRTKIAKISKCCTCLCFDFLPREKLLKWINRHFASEGFTVTANVASLIADRAACDMSIISHEISKLCAYMRHEGITEPSCEIVESVTGKKTVFEAFYVSNRILKRDIDGVMSYVTDALKKGAEPFSLIAELTGEIERLYRIKCAMKSGMSPTDISSKIGMHEYAVKLRMQALKTTRSSHLKFLLEKCYESDLLLKSTSADAQCVLISLITCL